MRQKLLLAAQSGLAGLRNLRGTKASAAVDLPVSLHMTSALSRLLQEDRSDLNLSHDGLTPTHLRHLSDKLGVDLDMTDMSQGLHRVVLPALAILNDGSCLILHRRDGHQIEVEGRDQRIWMPLNALEPHILSSVLTVDAGSSAQPHAEEQLDSALSSGNLFRGLLRLLWHDDRQGMGQLILASLLSNMFLIALPVFIMAVYDRVIPHAAFESLQTLTIGICLIFAIDLGLRYSRLKFADALGIRLSHRLQSHLYGRLLRQRTDKRPPNAAMMTSAQIDIDGLSLGFPEAVSSSVADVTFGISVCLLILLIGGPIVIVPMVGIITVMGLIALTATSVQKGAAQALTLRANGTALVTSTHDAFGAVKATGAEHNLFAQRERLSALAAREGHKHRHRSRYASNAAAVIIQLTIALTIAVGVARIHAGAMTIGSLAAITILVGRAVMPFGQLVDQWCKLRGLRETVLGAFATLPAPVQNETDTTLKADSAFEGGLRLTGVSYTPPGASDKALDNISLQIQPGQHVGLIGRNGSGKSTLLNILAQLYRPDDGRLFLNGRDARQYPASVLTEQIGFMPQETILFPTSLRENICLGLDSASDEMVHRAASLSGAAAFAARHPQGFSMPVGPRGEFLSAGERQAVGLARALLRRPSILILDEPTALMDNDTEAQVIKALAEIAPHTTIILSTHRLKILTVVDRLIALDQGKIVSDGPKGQVLPQLQKVA